MANKAPRKENEILLSKDSNALTKSKNKLKKQAKKRTEDKDKAKDDAEVEISMDTVLAVPGEAAASSLPTKTKVKASETQDGPMRNGGTADDDSDANSEVEAQEKMLNVKGKASKKTLMAFEQRDLVALAFAGDNVVHVGFWFLGVKSSLYFDYRNLKKQSGVRSLQMHPVRSIPPFLDGYVVFIWTLEHHIVNHILGFLGWDRHAQSTIKTTANQENRRRGPKNSS